MRESSPPWGLAPPLSTAAQAASAQSQAVAPDLRPPSYMNRSVWDTRDQPIYRSRPVYGIRGAGRT